MSASGCPATTPLRARGSSGSGGADQSPERLAPRRLLGLGPPRQVRRLKGSRCRQASPLAPVAPQVTESRQPVSRSRALRAPGVLASPYASLRSSRLQQRPAGRGVLGIRPGAPRAVLGGYALEHRI